MISSKYLKILFILLILNNYKLAFSAEKDCTQALNKGDYAAAISAADATLKQDNTLQSAWICKGRALSAQNKFDDALKALEQGKKTAKDKIEEALTTIFIGNVYRNQQKFAEALASYQQAVDLSLAANFKRYAWASHNLIGEIHQQNKDLKAALNSYNQADRHAMNDNEHADSYTRIASVHAALGQHDSAIEYQLKALLKNQAYGSLDDVANSNLMLGQYYLQAKDTKKAESEFTKLRDFAKTNGGTYYEAKALLMLAQTKLAANDSASAKTLLADAQTSAKTVGDAELDTEIANFAQTLPK